MGEVRIEPALVRPGLYVTFIANVVIYKLEQKEAGLALIETHRVDRNGVHEIVPKYYMLWEPSLHLIQTTETLQLNRESILNKLL